MSFNRNRISDEQRRVLDALYTDGMVGTGSVYKAKIDRAVEETGLTLAQVKKWIGNQKRVKKAGDGDDQVCSGNILGRAKAARGPSSYNLFCRDVFKQDKNLSLTEKCQNAARKWKKLNVQEKAEYNKLSVDAKRVSVDQLTDEQKGKLVKCHSKQLLEQIRILENLGCHVSMLVLDINGNVFQAGSSEGNQFLSCNPDIGIKFRGYFGNSSRSYSRNDVQTLFNKKYSEAVGKKCRVPYLKGGFKVHGMPDGIDFEKPFNYGASQIKKIMESADEISFIILEPERIIEAQTIEIPSNIVNNEKSEQVKNLLVKIAGVDSARKALEGQDEKILEEDVEVEDLLITDSEKTLLYASCSRFFSGDAWLAVGANMQHSTITEDLLLPIYTEAAERFWLFSAKAKPASIAKSVSTTKIIGRWLNLEAGGSYKILNYSDSIFGKNIIRTAHGPLYFSFKTDENNTFILTDAVRNTILAVLKESGFHE